MKLSKLFQAETAQNLYLLLKINLMENRNQPQGEQSKESRHEHPLPGEISKGERQQAAAAHDEAEKDMEQDADLSVHSPNDDLDEGETARLGEDKTDLV
jgi:hypothetical protein